ncbi:MAG: putative ABC transporter permease [Lachnospiraceae bacterium]|nr:putative ABC transporter permease [Lachnospiraceae bacterium]
MEYTLYELTWLFFVYSLAGWCIGVAAAAVRRRTFVNTGVLNLPFCPIYGVTAVSFSIFLIELKEQLFFLFLGGMVFTSVVTVLTGVVLQRIFRRKWWDFKRFRLQEDGYITVPLLLLSGGYAVFVLWLGNPLILRLAGWIPYGLGKIIQIAGAAFLVIDLFGVLTVVWKWRIQIRQIDEMTENMQQISITFGNAITRRVRKRLEKSFPNIQTEKLLEDGMLREKVEEKCFAEGCCFYKLVWLFFIGSFLGDLVEMIFCRVTMGWWMSRSSVVYGPFSIVWGLGCVLLTGMLYKYRNKDDRYIFLYGTVLGGAYEYLCSVFTELVFGTVFWDYSAIPFNLGGRVNLLYCFFWGIVAIIWLKGIYPRLSALIEKIPVRTGPVLTWMMIVFMTVNVAVSSFALIRYSVRYTGEPAQTELGMFLDEHFPDERMEQIYPKAKIVGKTGVQKAKEMRMEEMESES